MRLAVNIDHIATIREARKADEPDPIRLYRKLGFVESGLVVGAVLPLR